MNSSRRINRRVFLKGVGAAAVAGPSWSRTVFAKPAGDVVRHGSFGAMGMAATDLSQIASHPSAKLVCVADVDENRTRDVRKKFPEAKIYQDWREMLDKEGKNLDSVNVSVPDQSAAGV